MYFRITKNFLEKRRKKYLMFYFKPKKTEKTLSKSKIIENIIKDLTQNKKGDESRAYLSICEYCRVNFVIQLPAVILTEPRFCIRCGKTSPYHTFEHNLKRTMNLKGIASNILAKEEKNLKKILIEQSVVSCITSFEILLRDIYSLVIDLKHVIVGKSIYPRIYDSTRNEFLNLGSARKKIKKEMRLDIKNILGEDSYKYLSRMFSVRHIIIHNCSIKDKDFISQTGEDKSQLNKEISLRVSDLNKLINIARKVARILNNELGKKLLNYENRLFQLEDAILSLRSSS